MRQQRTAGSQGVRQQCTETVGGCLGLWRGDRRARRRPRRRSRRSRPAQPCRAAHARRPMSFHGWGAGETAARLGCALPWRLAEGLLCTRVLACVWHLTEYCSTLVRTGEGCIVLIAFVTSTGSTAEGKRLCAGCRLQRWRRLKPSLLSVSRPFHDPGLLSLAALRRMRLHSRPPLCEQHQRRPAWQSQGCSPASTGLARRRALCQRSGCALAQPLCGRTAQAGSHVHLLCACSSLRGPVLSGRRDLRLQTGVAAVVRSKSRAMT